MAVKTGFIKEFFQRISIQQSTYFLLTGTGLVAGTLYCIFSEKTFLLLILAENRTPFLDQLFQLLTRLGEEHIFIILILGMSFFSIKRALTLLLAGLSTIILSFLFKLLFQHPRPLTYLESLGESERLGQIAGYSFHDAYNSFPSGHTFSAFVLFTVLSLFTRPSRWQILFFILAAAGGFSRIYLGQHFPCDVVFGAFLGLMTGLLSYLIIFQFRMKNFRDRGLFQGKNQG